MTEKWGYKEELLPKTTCGIGVGGYQIDISLVLALPKSLLGRCLGDTMTEQETQPRSSLSFYTASFYLHSQVMTRGWCEGIAPLYSLVQTWMQTSLSFH